MLMDRGRAEFDSPISRPDFLSPFLGLLARGGGREAGSADARVHSGVMSMLPQLVSRSWAFPSANVPSSPST
jgi:hypothetical protein